MRLTARKDEASEAVCELLAPVIDEQLGDRVDTRGLRPRGGAQPRSPAAWPPSSTASGEAPRAKLGWSDVSFFSRSWRASGELRARRPALGPHAGEWVGRDDLEACFKALRELISPA